jgi:hypothetical protein
MYGEMTMEQAEAARGAPPQEAVLNPVVSLH